MFIRSLIEQCVICLVIRPVISRELYFPIFNTYVFNFKLFRFQMVVCGGSQFRDFLLLYVFVEFSLSLVTISILGVKCRSTGQHRSTSFALDSGKC